MVYVIDQFPGCEFLKVSFMHSLWAIDNIFTIQGTMSQEAIKMDMLFSAS